jgi:hypothetical protein
MFGNKFFYFFTIQNENYQKYFTENHIWNIKKKPISSNFGRVNKEARIDIEQL